MHKATTGRSLPDFARRITLELESRWRFDRGKRVFVKSSGERFSPRDDLPRGTRISYLDEELADADSATLPRGEKKLARMLNVVVPRGADPVAVAKVMEDWPCARDVFVTGDVSLPEPGGPGGIGNE